MSATNPSAVELKQGVHNLESLPALPVIAQRLLALDLDTHEGERRLMELIEQDPFISARIVGLANTPLFIMPQRVTCVRDATMLLGLTRVKLVALGIAMMTAAGRTGLGKLDLNRLWLHSLAVALGMRTIANAMPKNVRPTDEEIFLAGLLHDIGYVVLAHLDPLHSDALHMRLATDRSHGVCEFEAEMLGMGHAELGAELARHWDLPEEVVAVLRYHHSPAEADEGVGQPLICMLRLAEKILDPFGIPEGTGGVVSQEEWLSLGIDPGRGEELGARIRQQAEEAKASALQLG